MKNYLLCFLFLLFINPTISIGAAMTSLAVEFEIATPSDPEKQLVGYRLYREDELVYETLQTDVSVIDCNFPTKAGTFNFTLRACYNDGTESPPSSPSPITIDSTTVSSSDSLGSNTITYSWVNNFSDSDAIGYRMYMNDTLLCQTYVPSANSLSCNADLINVPMAFTVASFDINGIESARSNILTYNTPSGTATNQDSLQAVITPTKTSGEVPLNISFAGTASTGDISAYSWNFGDGTTGTGSVASHTYSKAGTYTATLIIIDQNGASHQATRTITAQPNISSVKPPTAVLSSSAATGNAPVTVTFGGASSTTTNPPIVSYSWTFGDGYNATGKTTTHTFTEAGTYYTELTVTDSKGLTDKVTTPVIVSATNGTNGPHTDDPTENPIDPLSLPEDSLNFEVGEISIDHEWVTVFFNNTFTDPVIIAGPPTSNGSHPVTIRIRNVDQEGFEIRLEEWDYLDGTHALETFNYVVIDKGTYTLDNGTKIEAGSFTGTSAFKQVSLQQSYEIPPVILTQVITNNEANTVTCRIDNVDQNSFNFKMQEMEMTHNFHAAETVDYLAWEPGKGEIFGLLYEVGTTAKKVTNNWYDLKYQTEFADLPLFIAGMQTYAGGDTVAVRTQNMSQSAVQVRVQEEQSLDTEITHTTEVIGYLSLSNSNKVEEQARLATFTWEYDSSQENNISGFRIYNNDRLVCKTTNPADRAITCETWISRISNIFSIKAIDISGSETNASNILRYNP